MPDSNALGHDDMERLTQHWRSRPDQLRQAIKAARAQYQLVPKLGRGFQPGQYLLGESRGGTALIGIVLAGDCANAECAAAVEQAVEFVGRHRHAFLPRRSGRKPGPNVRLEVFLPPGLYPDRPASVRGMQVQWFHWVPLDEQQVQIEKLAPRAGATGTDVSSGNALIPRLLGHLAWWERALRDGTGSETPYRKTLLVYSVATLLEWHVTVSGRAPQDQLPDAKANKTAREAVREFADAARAHTTKIQGAADDKATKQLGKLAAACARSLKKLAKLYGHNTRPERIAEFEQPIKPADLVSNWLALNETPSVSPRPVAHDLVVTGPGAFVLPSLAPALAAQKLFEAGKLTPEAYTAVRETCAEFLEPAVEIAVRESKGSERKRWRQVGRPAVEALRRPVAPRSGKGES